MKIAFVWTGFASYMADCWRELAAQPDVDLRVWIEDVSTGAGNQCPDKLMAGIPFAWRHTDDIDGMFCAQVEGEIAAFAPDALFICGWARNLPPYLAKSGSLAVIPKILCCDMPWEWKVRKFAARFVLWSQLRKFRKIMVPGESAARYARWLGFSADDIVRGEYSIDQRRFRQENRRGPREGFLFVGRHVPNKGLDTLERAAEIYRKAGGRWKVDVPASVDPADVPRIMGGHACLILPSRWEPWGVVVLEALSAGMRVIVSDRIGARYDLPVDRVFPSGNALELARVMQDIEQAPVEAPRASLEQYSSKMWTKRVIALVREVRAEK